MEKLDAVTAKQLGSPGTFAKKMRKAYLIVFAPAALCAVTAAFFALVHFWVFVGCFIAQVMMYLPVALRQHRSSGRDIERAVT